jgi:hypothetical protein
MAQRETTSPSRWRYLQPGGSGLQKDAISTSRRCCWPLSWLSPRHCFFSMIGRMHSCTHPSTKVVRDASPTRQLGIERLCEGGSATPAEPSQNGMYFLISWRMPGEWLEGRAVCLARFPWFPDVGEPVDFGLEESALTSRQTVLLPSGSVV